MNIAILENNYVKNVIVVNSAKDAESLFPANERILVTEQTGNPFIGERYLPNIEKFVTYSPYPSWILDETTAQWNAPKPYPSDGKPYQWNEDVQDWEVIEVSN